MLATRVPGLRCRWSSVPGSRAAEPRLCTHRRPLPSHVAGYLHRTAALAIAHSSRRRPTCRPRVAARAGAQDQFPEEDAEEYEFEEGLEEGEEGEFAEQDFQGGRLPQPLPLPAAPLAPCPRPRCACPAAGSSAAARASVAVRRRRRRQTRCPGPRRRPRAGQRRRGLQHRRGGGRGRAGGGRGGAPLPRARGARLLPARPLRQGRLPATGGPAGPG
jgi:hypothetical protein